MAARQLRLNTLGRLHRLQRFYLVQQQRKLFPATTRHQVMRTRVVHQDLGNVLQQGITRRMPPLVVDGFEVVNVDQQQHAQWGRWRG